MGFARHGLWLIPCLLYGLLAVSFAPAAWALSTFPPSRVLVVPRFVLMIGLVAWGSLVGWGTHRLLWCRAARKAAVSAWAVDAVALPVVVLLVIHPLLASWNLGRIGHRMHAQAAAWDNFDALVRESRGKEQALSIPAPDNDAELEVIRPDGQHWINDCASGYYGRPVTGYLPPPIPDPRHTQGWTSTDVEAEGAARILGYALRVRPTRAGAQLDLTVRWLPLAHTPRPYKVFVELRDAQRRSLGEFAGEPWQGKYQTTVWVPGRLFEETYALAIPAAKLPVSGADLVFGLHDDQSRERAPVRGRAAGSPADRGVRVAGVQLP
jgi:hypothetical protein